MENWQKDIAEIIETVADEVDRFFLGMGEMVDAFFELTEEITDQLQNTIGVEVDHKIDVLTSFLQDASC